ncbi:MAG: hypothetical protein ACJ8F2_24325 [Xanthobacteraceae bacterium]
MTPLSLRLSLVAVGALVVTTWLIVPRAVEAGRWLAAADDPVALADLTVDQRLDRRTAEREIEAALAAGDTELAESFLELARERHIAVDPALAARIGTDTAAATARGVGHFVRGLVVGEPDDLASLAGTVTGDLFVFGDARDALREGVRLARGEEADELILGLACVGLAVTAATYASFGVGTPARVGLSVVKAARRTGRIGPQLSGAVVRAVKESVDAAAVKQAFTRAALVRPALAVRAAREAVKVQKAGGLLHLVRDVGRVQAKAGSRAALDGLRLADNPKDVARLATLAQAKGTKTRAIIKLAGRGAIMLTTGLMSLASWVFWAVINLFMLCAMLKRSVERITMHVIRRRRAHRARLRERPLAPGTAAV